MNSTHTQASILAVDDDTRTLMALQGDAVGGIALFPEHGDSAQALLQAAGEALLRSKQAVRNRVVIGEETGSAQEPTGAERLTALCARGAAAMLPARKAGDAA